MAKTRNVFISHVHEDDNLIPSMKNLIFRNGMDVRDGSIDSSKPNNAKNKEYIMNKVIAPRIRWASVLVVLITRNTKKSEWVNWEIEYANKKDKPVVGVLAQGITDKDIPEIFNKLGDAAIVGWQGEKIIDAIEGKNNDWHNPVTGEKRAAQYEIKRIDCQ